VRTLLRIFGFAALTFGGVMLASPLLTLLIPGCPQPPQWIYPLGIGSGLLAVFTFASVEWFLVGPTRE
jgi:hypothetical protein